ncbi:MAG: sugar phosphate isomerase/epimerase family protein, partial [Thermomicrobiales bacterium]
MKLGINLEYIRHADKPFEYGIREGHKIGYRYVEPCVSTGYDFLALGGFYHMLSMEEDPSEIKELCDSVGVKIEGVSGHSCLMAPDTGVHYLRRAIQWASDVGATIVNTDDGIRPIGMDDETAMTMIRYTLTKSVRTAERYGITIALEDHQVFTQDVDNFNKIMNMVDSANLKINYDTGNAYIYGNDPVDFLRALGPERVVHLHAKDISTEMSQAQRGKVTGVPVGCACGEGVVDWKTVLTILRDAGFKG